jgi:hypothetical protein
VPKWHGRHLGAFGSLNRSDSDLRSELRSLREKCRQAAQRAKSPYIGKDRHDALRHLYGHAMQLDVIFQPLRGWFPIRDKSVRTHNKRCLIYKHPDSKCSCKWNTQAFAWTDNPVWGHAPNGALAKARRFCNVLNTVVAHGHMIDLTHDLVRISKMIWKMSQKDFMRLCRRIVARIAKVVREHRQEIFIVKSPEPVVRFGALTTNPTIIGCVYWVPPSKDLRRARNSRYVPRYVPPHRRSRLASQACESLKQLLAARPPKGA